MAAALAGFTRIDTFQENIIISYEFSRIVRKFCLDYQPGLLLVVAETVGGVALVATSADYSGRMMQETCI